MMMVCQEPSITDETLALLQEDLVDFAGGKTWYRWVNFVPPDKGGLQGLATAWQRRYSPAAPDKVSKCSIVGGMLAHSQGMSMVYSSICLHELASALGRAGTPDKVSSLD